MATLLPLRGLQGFAAGLFIPLGQALVYRLYSAHERPRVTMAIMAIGLLAPAVSPLAGGWLSQRMPWQWVLLASLPMALLALLLGACWLPRPPAAARNEPFDGKGLLLAGAGVASGLLGMTDAGVAKVAWLWPGPHWLQSCSAAICVTHGVSLHPCWTSR